MDIYIKNGGFHTKLFGNSEITLASIFQRCHFTAPISQTNCFMGVLDQSFLKFLEQPAKLKIFLELLNSC